eukprot:TRINITY_DN2630_c0_g1_i2.p1 TRINITY_DN2630_c0_g1~~TRINITY_DN2630_c0_g1_i2.p1  ORF type:complete len:175 (+),score=37.91 TRINITY_DN2630_c0_g1_i2:209-733(+)
MKQNQEQGKTVVCHCNGGKGRSGTMIVATLVGLGHKVQKAIDIVRKARSGTIRNPLQIMYVKRFKTAWLQHLKKKYGTETESVADITETNVNNNVTEDPLINSIPTIVLPNGSTNFTPSDSDKISTKDESKKNVLNVEKIKLKNKKEQQKKDQKVKKKSRETIAKRRKDTEKNQ